MTKDEALRLALKAMKVNNSAWKHLADSGDAGYWEAEEQECYQLNEQAITAIKAALANEALERKAENARELGLDYEPYGFEASMYSNDRMKVDSVTGNVSIGTVTKPCGLECDCTDVCKQDDYKALWQQMCERCDELDKKLAQRTWLGLTDEDYIKALELCDFDKDAAFDFFEAKLKELNT